MKAAPDHSAEPLAPSSKALARARGRGAVLALVLMTATAQGSRAHEAVVHRPADTLGQSPGLVLLADATPQQVFGGGTRTVSTVWRNLGAQPVTASISSTIYQASSATAAPLQHVPWKTLEVLPAQTVLESAVLAFPAVRGQSHFLVQWVQGSNQVLGVTQVLVYPTNLLAQLKDLLDKAALGLYDPQKQLKPLLTAAGVPFSDLESTGVEHFTGPLAILGPFVSQTEVPRWLRGSIRTLARKGTGVVWILPLAHENGPMKPSFYAVVEGKGAVVVAQPALVSNLAENPESQLNLLELCRLVLNPEPPCLPLLSSAP